MRRARQLGLSIGPLESTLRDALAFEELRGGPVGAGLRDETERWLREELDLCDDARSSKHSAENIA